MKRIIWRLQVLFSFKEKNEENKNIIKLKS